MEKSADKQQQPAEREETGSEAAGRCGNMLTEQELEQLHACLQLLRADSDESKFVGLLMVCKLEGIGDKTFEEVGRADDGEDTSQAQAAQRPAADGGGEQEVTSQKERAHDAQGQSSSHASVRRALFEAVGLRFLQRLLKTRGASAADRLGFVRVAMNLLSFFAQDPALCSQLRNAANSIACALDESLQLLVRHCCAQTAGGEGGMQSAKDTEDAVNLATDAAVTLLRIVHQSVDRLHAGAEKSVQTQLDGGETGSAATLVHAVASGSPVFRGVLFVATAAILRGVVESWKSTSETVARLLAWQQQLLPRVQKLIGEFVRLTAALWNMGALQSNQLVLPCSRAPMPVDRADSERVTGIFVNHVLLPQMCSLFQASEPPLKFDALEVLLALLSSSPPQALTQQLRNPRSWLVPLKTGLIDVLRARNVETIVKNTAYAMLGVLATLFEQRPRDVHRAGMPGTSRAVAGRWYGGMRWMLVGEGETGIFPRDATRENVAAVGQKGRFLKFCLHLAAIEVKLALDHIAGVCFNDKRVTGEGSKELLESISRATDFFEVPGFNHADARRVSACLQIVHATIDALCEGEDSAHVDGDDTRQSLADSVDVEMLLSYRQPLMNALGVSLEFVQETALIFDSLEQRQRLEDVSPPPAAHSTELQERSIRPRLSVLVGTEVEKYVLPRIVAAAGAWLAEEDTSSTFTMSPLTLAFLLRWNSAAAVEPTDGGMVETLSSVGSTLPYLVPWLCMMSSDSVGCEQLVDCPAPFVLSCGESSGASELGGVGFLLRRVAEWVNASFAQSGDMSRRTAAGGASVTLSVDDVCGLLRCIWCSCRDSQPQTAIGASRQVFAALGQLPVAGAALDRVTGLNEVAGASVTSQRLVTWLCAILIEAVAVHTGSLQPSGRVPPLLRGGSPITEAVVKVCAAARRPQSTINRIEDPHAHRLPAEASARALEISLAHLNTAALTNSGALEEHLRWLSALR
eukprot:INCI12822.3.p1 GENE.INCI12822.3~~INCI12822.3.p1  ORF type:complete len:975 (+),score=175.83 INCI12822.3:3150-6074(+)